jgi:hypothetical protein
VKGLRHEQRRVYGGDAHVAIRNFHTGVTKNQRKPTELEERWIESGKLELWNGEADF